MALPYNYQKFTDASQFFPDPRRNGWGSFSPDEILDWYWPVTFIDGLGEQVVRAIRVVAPDCTVEELPVAPTSPGVFMRRIRKWPIGTITGGWILTNSGSVIRPLQSQRINSDRDTSNLAHNTTLEHWRSRYQKNCAALSLEHRTISVRPPPHLDPSVDFSDPSNTPQPPDLLQHVFGYDPANEPYAPPATGVPSGVHQGGLPGSYAPIRFFKRDPGVDLLYQDYLDNYLPAVILVNGQVPERLENDWMVELQNGIYGRRGHALRMWYVRFQGCSLA